MSERSPVPQTVAIITGDGYSLGAQVWHHDPHIVSEACNQPVVIINCATAVLCRYYQRFAGYLHEHGFAVVIYDYRGIGLSRPSSMARLQAGWLQWGAQDFEAVINYVSETFEASPIYVVGHSVGGLLLGLAPSNHRIDRVVTVGAQHAYWPDYLPRHRTKMVLQWHGFMPLVTRMMGYFPGKRLGWLEDVPAGVVRDWVAKHERFIDTYRYGKGSATLDEDALSDLQARFAALSCPMLALSFTDDPYGTEPAIARLLANYSGCDRHHLRLTPQDVGVQHIGHFAYFHSQFRETLWPLALQWLQRASLQDPHLGRFVQWQSADDHPDVHLNQQK